MQTQPIKYNEEVDGKLQRKQKESAGFDTPQEAEREGIRIKAEIQLGTYIEEKDPFT